LSVDYEDNNGQRKAGKLVLQPDAAATLLDRRDAFGMMEIKRLPALLNNRTVKTTTNVSL